MRTEMKLGKKLLLLFLAVVVIILANLFFNPYFSPYLYLLNTGVIVFRTSYIGEYGGMSLYRWGILTPLIPPEYYISSVAKQPLSGSKIAFAYRRELITNNTYFALFDVKTHEITPIFYVDEDDILSDQYPGERYWFQFAWSPDGKQILYSTPASKDRQELMLFDVQTGKSESTSIFLDSMQDGGKLFLDDLAWGPGFTPLVSIRYETFNKRESKLYSIDSKFTQLTYVIDGAEAEWLSDGKTIIYFCLAGNTCTYSFETKEQQVHEVNSTYWQSSPDGLFVFGLWGEGEEGERQAMAVYNGVLHKTQFLPSSIYNLLFFGGDFSVR